MNLSDLRRPEYAGVLPDPAGQPPETDRQRAGLFRETLRRDFPGPAMGNRWTQTEQYQGTAYAAIKTIWSWLSGSTVAVEEKRSGQALPIRKALPTPGGLGRDEKYHPVEDDDLLLQLFEHINSVDTFQDFIAQLVIQVMLTGNGYIWIPLNGEGRPAEMWVLPSTMIQYVPPSAHYPFGGLRLNGYGGNWSAVGIPASTAVLDRREVLHYREPHPRFRWDGYGPTQAGARQVDAVNAIETSRTSKMEKGVNTDLVITVKGITQEQATTLKQDIMRGNGGSNKAGEPFVTDGESVDVEGLGPPIKDMDYPAGWEQSVRAVLAIFRVPPGVAGMLEANYAEFWAAVRAFFAGELTPFSIRLAAFLTKHLARRFYGRDKVIKLNLPAINDPEDLRQWVALNPGPLYDYNEARAVAGLPPKEGGDVPVTVYVAQQNAAVGLGPDGQPLQQPGMDAEPGGDAGQDMEGHPLSALGDAILEGLGVEGEHPGNDPLGGDDDDADSDLPDTDLDDDSRDRPFGKAFNRFEENKHPRDAGKFSSKPGAGAAPPSAAQRGLAPAGAGQRPASPLPPGLDRHPAIRRALQHLSSKAAHIGQLVTEAAVAAQLTPQDVIGDAQSWQVYFATQHADFLANQLHVDYQTAFAVLSHLAAHGVMAIKRHLGRGTQKPEQQQPAPRPGLARPATSRDTGGQPSRPENPGGAGSLPNRMKAFPDISVLLDEVCR